MDYFDLNVDLTREDRSIRTAASPGFSNIRRINFYGTHTH